MAEIKLGCCGWGFFNPKRLLGENWRNEYKSTLQAYASLFDLVEVNSTFYKLPRVSTAEKWLNEARDVNSNFEFTVKAHQDITHKLKFGKESVSVFNEVKEVAKALEAKIIVFQTPASFKPTDENLKRARDFFDNIERENFILAWEVRWVNTWKREIVEKFFGGIKVEHVVDPFRQDCFYSETLMYYRLHGLGRRMYDYTFSEKELNELRDKVKNAKRSVYVLFNNYNMYEDCLKFRRVLGDGKHN